MNFKDFFHVQLSEDYNLKRFSFLNSIVTDETNSFDPHLIEDTKVENFTYNGNSFTTDVSAKFKAINSNKRTYRLNGVDTNSSYMKGVLIQENKKIIKK